MFALCNSDEAKKVHVDVRKGCNFTDFNCTEVVVHNGTGSVNLFAQSSFLKPVLFVRCDSSKINSSLSFSLSVQFLHSASL